jgi:RNA polymerase sigma factor (TIGR02999 family)
MSSNVTLLLDAAERGDHNAARELLPLVYEELRRLAAAHLDREKPGQTLSATALVHEAYLRLVGGDSGAVGEAGAGGGRQWSGRGHFFGAAAQAMRRILVENARRKKSLKRGGAWVRQTLDSAALASPQADDEILALDEALERFEREQPVKAQLVNLRYFAGLTQAQAAELLGISMTTADRYWAYARAWLHQEITGGEAGDPRA